MSTEERGSEDDLTPRSSSAVHSDPPLATSEPHPHSPPIPPPDFNPPADFPTDSPVSSISTPSTSSVTSPRNGLPSYYPLEPVSSTNSPSGPSEGGAPLNRPQLQAFQRVSQESIPTPGSGTSSVSSNQSEGGDHLAEMREGLKEWLQSEATTPARTRASSISTNDNFRYNLINPTPPSEALQLGDLTEEDFNEAGPSKPRRLSSAALAHLEDGQDLPTEHAWDSVWPAPGSMHRSGPPDPGPSRFPIAPVSPFVTPSFSPAIISTTSSSRKPPSPVVDPHDPVSPSRRPQSPAGPSSSGPGPFRFSPRSGGTSPNMDPHSHGDMFYGGRRRSITSDASLLAHSPPTTAPISINLNKHNRSLSNSSQNSPQGRFQLHRGSPIQPSPPRSPLKPPLTVPTDNAKIEPAPHSAPPTKLTNPGASPPLSALTKSRPRGKSLSSVRPSLSELADLRQSPRIQAERKMKDSGAISPLGSSLSLPPIALPPPIAEPPVKYPSGGPSSPVTNVRPNSPPLFAPLARPAILRRALSDYDPKARNTPPSFHRTLSITAELDKSPKRTTSDADMPSPVGPDAGEDRDTTRAKKSPKASPLALPMITPIAPLAAGPVEEAEERVGDLAQTQNQSYFPDMSAQPEGMFAGGFAVSADHMGDVELIDEGDMLPQGDVQMDVTFDDEGLNTLERIFLLSKSEYPFHRAYVARVLGDLLNEVDPCESVEYVLPLLSGFSMDEDESVKEAFASELHRILWYFFSTCKLLFDDGQGEMVEVPEPEPVQEETSPDSRKHTLTITSEGVDMVPTPTLAEATEGAIPMGRQRSNTSLLSTAGPSSGSSNLTRPGSNRYSPSSVSDNMDVDTPNSSVSNYSVSSQETAFSPGMFIKPYADDGEGEERGYTKEQGALVDRPVLGVNFFTPLVGSLMLNQNPVISESVRNGIVAVLGRLRGKGEMSIETWGHAGQQVELDERKGYATQNGPHQHDLRPFTSEAKSVVERELLHGIIIGMGQLSTEMPDMIFDDPESSEDDIRDHEAFQAQLIQEATAGRATSMNLIGSVCEFYEDHEVVENGFVEEVLASGDGDVPVRAEAAVAMSSLAKMVPKEFVYQMLPLFEQFCQDENDHVKQSACLSLPALCKRIESQDYRRSFAINAVQTLMNGNEDVRCAALEMLGEVIHIFYDDARGPPAELLEVYTDDSEVREGERDSDWDVVAIFNFPGVCLTLGPNRWSEIRDLFQRLQDRAGDKVLRTTASSLHELAKILRPQQVVSDLLPIYTRLLGGSEEIRERVFEHVDVIIDSVPIEVGWRLFRHLAQGWKEAMLGGWRAREKLALHIPSFLKTFESWDRVEEVLEMMQDALLDPFAAVRDAATKGIPAAYEVLGTKSDVAKRFRDILLDLGDSSVFKRRLTFVRCLREFVKPPPNRTAFEDFFLPVLPRLSQDVVDVRLGLAQIIADLFVVGAYYAGVDETVPKMIWQLAEGLAHDDAVDVRDTVRKVDMDRAVQKHHGHGQSQNQESQSSSSGGGKGGGKGKEVEVPYEIKTEYKPDRALRPGERSPVNSKSASSDGKAFPSVSNSAVASATSPKRSNSRSSRSSSAKSKSNSTSTSESGLSSGTTSSTVTSASSSSTSTPSSSASRFAQSIRDRIGYASEGGSEEATPTQSLPQSQGQPQPQPQRRPSAEVSAKMGSMHLSTSLSSSSSSSSLLSAEPPAAEEDDATTPRLGMNADEGGSRKRRERGGMATSMVSSPLASPAGIEEEENARPSLAGGGGDGSRGGDPFSNSFGAATGST
ncbi:hypothetical protein IAT40_005653 [Kwoniella sp. CBS 6097]